VIVSRFFVLPGTGSTTVRTQDGVPRGTFFSKNVLPSTPSGQRFRVRARSRRCGRSTSETAVTYASTSPLVVPVDG
jgi:hypothetical protein